MRSLMPVAEYYVWMFAISIIKYGVPRILHDDQLPSPLGKFSKMLFLTEPFFHPHHAFDQTGFLVTAFSCDYKSNDILVSCSNVSNVFISMFINLADFPVIL
jgi:hypothetical protein